MELGWPRRRARALGCGGGCAAALRDPRRLRAALPPRGPPCWGAGRPRVGPDPRHPGAAIPALGARPGLVGNGEALPRPPPSEPETPRQQLPRDRQRRRPGWAAAAAVPWGLLGPPWSGRPPPARKRAPLRFCRARWPGSPRGADGAGQNVLCGLSEMWGEGGLTRPPPSQRGPRRLAPNTPRCLHTLGGGLQWPCTASAGSPPPKCRTGAEPGAAPCPARRHSWGAQPTYQRQFSPWVRGRWRPAWMAFKGDWAD